MPTPIEEQKHPGGRPEKFRNEYIKQVFSLCLLGATDKDLATFFEVNEDTINEWKKTKPEFSESLKRGKTLADAKVANALYRKAIGKKGQPGDTTAMIFWLKNRQRDNWRDKQEIDHTSGGNEFKRFTLNVKPDTGA